MAGERADCGAGAGFTPRVRDLGAEKRAQPGLDESPCTHILRFFLTPNKLRRFWKGLEHFPKPVLSQGIELLDTDERCVVDFTFRVVLQQIVINFAGTKDDALYV